MKAYLMLCTFHDGTSHTVLISSILQTLILMSRANQAIDADLVDPWLQKMTLFGISRGKQLYIPLRNIDICVLRSNKFRRDPAAVSFRDFPIILTLSECVHHSLMIYAPACLHHRHTWCQARTSRASVLPSDRWPST